MVPRCWSDPDRCFPNSSRSIFAGATFAGPTCAKSFGELRTAGKKKKKKKKRKKEKKKKKKKKKKEEGGGRGGEGEEEEAKNESEHWIHIFLDLNAGFWPLDAKGVPFFLCVSGCACVHVGVRVCMEERERERGEREIERERERLCERER